MENLNRLLERYQGAPRVKELNKALQGEGPTRMQLLGLRGAMECFVLAGSYQADRRHHLFIGLDKEDAAYIQNTLAGLLEKKTIHFLPDSFKRPLYFEVLDNNNVLQRTEAINQITTSKATGEIIVTYPEALFEKVVAPEVLSANRMELTVGEDLDVNTLIDVLVEYGFKREDFVYEPGQFSVRGGIVDVYSYGNDYPYRVELFDEEVETIRTFDPMTQLSRQNIKKLSIVPNINTRFKQEEKVSIFQVLPLETVIWVKDFQLLLDKLQQCFEKAEDFARTVSSLDERELAEIFRDRAFIRPGDVIGDVEQYSILCMAESA
ncbi:MAG: transcription-repair coupling factor, partial [Lewinella sp.]|nr:transcription-repair coupling factor [Lewinella sp.]